ncbi:MAG TPA: nucleoside recognition domain-containing protein, partial [Methanoculleus sp.]
MPVISSVVNAVLLVIAGVILANILAETGIFSRLSSFTGPLCRFSGLSDACVLSIVAMGVNATAGKSMLAEYYRDGKVTEREVIPVLIMGAFPVVLGESLFRVQLPTALVLLGPVVGGVYTGLNLFSSG